MRKAKDIDTVSAIYPIRTGAIAPPTIDMIKNEEALLVCSPNPLMDKAKIVGNMIDSHKKHKKKAAYTSHSRCKDCQYHSQ